MHKIRTEKHDIVKSYIEKYNPYEKIPPLGYDVQAVSRYATIKGCSVSDLSKEEVDMFRS